MSTPAWKNASLDTTIPCGICGAHLTHKQERDHACWTSTWDANDPTDDDLVSLVFQNVIGR